MLGDSTVDGTVNRRALLTGAATIAGGALLGAAAVPASAASVQAVRAVRAAAPRVHTRAEWAARPPKVAATVLDQAPDHIVVHHTASANSTDYSLDQAFSLSRSIQNFHMDSNGWDDTGQQLTLSRGGHLMEGRNLSLPSILAGRHVVGAQTANENSHTIGIENEGLYMTEDPTAALWSGLVATCAWLCETYGLDPAAAIVGHRDYNATACPGDRLYAMLPQLRAEVAAQLGKAAGGRAPAPRRGGLPGPRRTFDHGPALGPADPTR